jgi:hypothetical protein
MVAQEPARHKNLMRKYAPPEKQTGSQKCNLAYMDGNRAGRL